MNSKLIRAKWLNFFEANDHLIIPSKSLIPQNDPSLLWINSGVATLKEYFEGKKNPPSTKMVNSQKVIRTNDIENVGVTARHHTFFEMLGNFSIGDYFKKEAIELATKFLLEELKLDKDKLYFTYYYEDLETKNLWIKQGFSEEHMIAGDKKTNFWEVGSGPCGPNTEIFYDRGTKYDQRGVELLKNDIENDRYIEIWNIVFSTFNSDGQGNYTELKQKNIDTGAGFERIVSILQDAPTNFDTDLFLPIIHEIEKYTKYRYDADNYFVKEPKQAEINTYFKVIADHMRAVVNAAGDGAKPSNVGRGYIIRRLIRRSLYFTMLLGIKKPILHKLVQVVKNTLPYEYNQDQIIKIIIDEEQAFAKTVENGRQLLNKHISEDQKIFDGALAFKLFETYGFPFELTEEILASQGISIDKEAYLEAKTKHENASKGNKVSGMDKVINSLTLITQKVDNFVGYEFIEAKTEILYLLDQETEQETIEGIGYLVLKQTPFYATSGGQRHDKGYITQNNRKITVLDVFKDKYGNHIHKVSGTINKIDPVECFVDPKIRLGLERNHSGTHFLFAALRTVLGPQIKQLGSDNNEERLTFDFPADTKPTNEQIAKIENLVKSYIKLSSTRHYLNMTTNQAKEMGAIMTLEEAEYMDPNSVRIVKFDNITADLCGGTHLSNSGKLENFKIISVEKKSATVFRIRAISSHRLVNEYLKNKQDELLQEVNNLINRNKLLDQNYTFEPNLNNNLEDSINLLNNAISQIRNDYVKLQKQKETNTLFSYDNIEFKTFKGFKFSLLEVSMQDNPKVIATTLREKYLDTTFFVVTKGLNPMLVVASKILNSNFLAQQIFQKFNGKGGGNAILSMGKIASTENLTKFIQEGLNWEN
ncbi:alanine--tRNA ligase [Mycoplasmopsis bovirhinis]|uniref:Alanine--tRNA ligase n=1 Tax=Mycoplasmopsis bovirhinis TaxID=29553 RepID=A0A449AEV0_9BACT|nr:alanine--tRNA ligase [Mycoplasmopsis bovirhinis]VEU63502.1 Alanine--tRNA ligase [Mycoplasmopsis bovirhinis]